MYMHSSTSTSSSRWHSSLRRQDPSGLSPSRARGQGRSFTLTISFVFLLSAAVNLAYWFGSRHSQHQTPFTGSAAGDRLLTRKLVDNNNPYWTFGHLQEESIHLLDSCRRCAAFSASDFAASAPDLHLASLDPDWPLLASLERQDWADQQQQQQAAGTAAGGAPGAPLDSALARLSRAQGTKVAAVATSAAAGPAAAGAGGGASGPGSDVRRSHCRDVGPFLSTPPGLEDYHRRIVKYIRSPEYRARAAAAAGGGRGILISAGGSRYLTNLIVTLRVLRHHYNCTLPVEVAWQGPSEMDPATLASLERQFSPLRGFDVKATPHPVKGLHGDTFEASSYSGKVYALAMSRFSQVLMVDADSLPLMDPTVLFEDPRFVQYGSLFWPDAWTGLVRSSAFGTYGVHKDRATVVLSYGQGGGLRNTESGQLLVDRARHLDMLEALLLINRQPNVNVGLMWGDKDTFWMAFAMVGKAHCFNQVQVPPAASLYWVPDKLRIKATGEVKPGWLLGGFVQFLEDAPFVYGAENGTAAAAATPLSPASSAAATASARRVLRTTEALPTSSSSSGPSSSSSSSPATAPGSPAGASSLVGSGVATAPTTTGTTTANGPTGTAPTPTSTSDPIPTNTNTNTGDTSAGGGRGDKAKGSATDPSTTPASASAPTPPRPRNGPAGRPSRPGEHLLAHLSGLVQPAFLHRTINKLRVDEQPHLVELVTAPMTQAWASYFLAHDNPGPTVGVPWDYCVPESSVRILTATTANHKRTVTPASTTAVKGTAAAGSSSSTPSNSSSAAGPAGLSGLSWLPTGSDLSRLPGYEPGRFADADGSFGLLGKLMGRRGGGTGGKGTARTAAEAPVCPLVSLAGSGGGGGGAGCSPAAVAMYLEVIDSGLPVDRHPAFEAACRQQLLDAAAAVERGVAAAFVSLAAKHSTDVEAYLAGVEAGEVGTLPLPRSSVGPLAYLDTLNKKGGAHGKPAGSPGQLPAVQHDWQKPWPCADAPFADAVRASYAAYEWVLRHRKDFPMLDGK